jgi:hypothetical protein
MQQYSTHRSSSTPWLIAAVGVGAGLANRVSAPRPPPGVAAPRP